MTTHTTKIAEIPHLPQQLHTPISLGFFLKLNCRKSCVGALLGPQTPPSVRRSAVGHLGFILYPRAFDGVPSLSCVPCAQVGARVKGRVLTVDAGSSKTTLTLKRSLVKDERKAITSYQEVSLRFRRCQESVYLVGVSCLFFCGAITTDSEWI